MNNIESLLDEIQTAQTTGDTFLEAQSNAKIGKLLLERNIYQDAVHYYQRAADLFGEENRINHQSRSLNHLGICLVMLNQPKQAIKPLTTAQKLAEADGDHFLSASAGGNLGLAYSALDDYAKAIESHKSVLENSERLQDRSLQLTALINLADCYLQNKNYQSAQGFALVALDLSKSLDSLPSQILVYDLLGMITSHSQDLRSAVEYHQQAYQIAASLGDLHRQGIALANQGLALEGLTELQAAFQAIEQAREIFLLLNSDYLQKTNQDLERIKTSLF
ncbi:MAG: tetratricopeptide repeat protein [Anaerolineales bacterium]